MSSCVEGRKAHTFSLPLDYVPFSEHFALLFHELQQTLEAARKPWWRSLTTDSACEQDSADVRGDTLVLIASSLLYRKVQAGGHLVRRRFHTLSARRLCWHCGVGLNAGNTLLNTDRRKWATDCETGWVMWLSVCLVSNRPRILPPALQKKKKERRRNGCNI